MYWLLLPLAGLWSMDRNTAFNFMISRPLVVASVIGGLYGHFGWCLLGGIFFEITGLMDLPVGTRISKDDTFAAFAYALTISMITEVTIEHALFIMIVCYLLMYPATYSVIFIRWINKQLYLKYNKAGSEGFLIICGQIITFLRGVIVYFGGSMLISRLLINITDNIALPGASVVLIAIIFCFIAGYFSGFLHDSARIKLTLLIAGGVFSWLVL